MTQMRSGNQFEGPMPTSGRSSKVDTANGGSSDSKKQVVKFVLDMAYLGVMCAASVILTNFLRDMMGDQMDDTGKKSDKHTKDRLNRPPD